MKSKKTKDINLIEFETEYVLLVIDEIKNVIPNITSENFKRKIYRRLIERDILYQNTKLIEKIKVGSFKESDFFDLANKNQLEIKNVSIDGIRDNNFFSAESNSKLFKLKRKNFTIIEEIEQRKTFLAFIKDVNTAKFEKTLDNFDKYYYETIINLKNNIYSSYDIYINQKYKVDINYQTLDRLKNSFR